MRRLSRSLAMDCYLFVVLFAVLLLLRSTGGDSALTVEPGSTVPLNTLVHCTCNGTGDSLLWVVESLPLTDAIKQQRDISVTDSHSGSNLSSVLTITALPVNHRVGIGCWIDFVSVGYSELTITGVSPVEDLHIGFTSDGSLNLTWSPPVFYSRSSDVPDGSIITYQVLIANETGDPIVDTTVSTPSIILANITACDTFNVNVTALYAQYTSVDSSIEYNGSLSFNIEDYSVNLNQVPILFRVTSTPTQCNGTVLIEPYCDGHNVSTHQLTVHGSNDPVRLINYTLTDLDPFRRYDVSVKLMDPVNATRNEEFISISTYHVQGLVISSSTDQQQQQQYTNGSVRVKCLFIEGGSTADGCHVIFTSTTDQAIEPQAFNITGSNERIFTLSVSSNYTVTAYDLVNGTIIGPSVEYSTPVEVIILPVPAPVSATGSISSSSSSSITVMATRSTLSVTSVSVSSTAASSTPQATDENQTVFTAIVVICVILLLLLVSGVGVIVAVCFVTKRSRKKQATVTTNGEMALCYQPHADTNHYMERPQLTNVSFNNEKIVPDSPAIDQSTTVPLVEDPYFVHRNEFVPATRHPSLPSVANATTTDMELSSVNNQASYEVTPQNDGTAADNKHLYAELTPANKEKVPHKPPAGDTSVQYSTAAGHTNEAEDTTTYTYPINEHPPPQYENINQFSSPVQEDSSSTCQYTPTISHSQPSMSDHTAPIVHSYYESPPYNDSEDVINYSTVPSSSSEEMTIPVIGNTLSVIVPSPDKDNVNREGVIISSPITANDSSISNTAMWLFKPSASSRIVSDSAFIEDAPVAEKIRSSNELISSELVIASYKVSFPICSFSSPVHTSSVAEESSNYEVLPVVKPEEMGIINVMEKNESHTKCKMVPSTEGIVLRESKMMSKLRVMFANLQQTSLLERDTFLRLQVSITGRGDIKFNMCPISIPCLFNGYYSDTANRIIMLNTPTFDHGQWHIPNVVSFNPEREKSCPVEMTSTRFGF